MEPEVQIEAKKSVFRKLIKGFFWTVGLFLLLCFTAILLVFVYEDKVKEVVIAELNKNLNCEIKVDPANIDLTFISSFPKCAIEFNEFAIMESWNKKSKDTLAYIGSLRLKFSLKDIFNKRYNISAIELVKARLDLKEDKNGKVNYEIWKDAGEENEKEKNDSLNFVLEHIDILESQISYRNKNRSIKTEFFISELAFKGKFTESAFDLSSKGKILHADLLVDKTNYFKNKSVDMDIVMNVDRDLYHIEKADLSLNKMKFKVEGDLNYQDSLKSLQMKYTASNLDINSILSLLPERYRNRINDYKSDGEFYAGGDLNYTAGNPLSIRSDFGVKNASVEYKPAGTQLKAVNLTGKIQLNKNNSFLQLQNISANLEGDQLSGNFNLNDFDAPVIDVNAKGEMDLGHIFRFWPIDTLEKLEGKLSFNTHVTGAIAELKEKTFSDKAGIEIDALIKGLNAKFKKDEKGIEVENCHILSRDRDVKVEDLTIKRGNSNVIINGEIPGLFNFILNSKSELNISGDLKSKYFNVDDFISPGSTSGSAETEYNIPGNLNLKLDVSAEEFVFNKFKAEKINGNFELKKSKIMISDMNFETMQGKAEADALIDASGNDLQMDLQAQLNGINVQQLFEELNNFGQGTLTDKHVKGIVTSGIAFSGSWDKKLNANLKSIVSSATLNIERGELNDFKPLESLSKYVDLEELKRIKFSSLTSTLSIHDKVIYIPKTALKNSALNIDFSGTHDFDNNIDYHIRLLISELLAKKRKADDEFGPVENDPENKRSAFILMTGNIDNIKVKYDKQGLKQKIKEDIKQEKQNLKQILKEEFGLFKNDSIKVKETKKSEQKFELEKADNKKAKKTLEPKKKEDDDDDF